MAKLKKKLGRRKFGGFDLTKTSSQTILIFITAFVLVGMVALFAADAAAPTISLEPDGVSSTITAPAVKTTDATASKGNYVQFKASAGSGGGGSTTYGYRGTPGIPAGTTLATYTGPNPITANGTVLNGVYIAGGLTINADNVTVKNSHIDGPGGDDNPAILVNGRSAIISHNLIGKSSNILSGHFGVRITGGGNDQVIGNDIWHIHGGVYLWADGVTSSDSVLIQDNWVHQMTANAGDHMNNITSECSYNVTVDHNRLEGAVMPGSQADTAFTMSVYSDDQTGCSITKSSPYIASNGDHIAGLKNLVFTNNYGDGHGSYGLWFNDVVGTITIANNMESNSGYGYWLAPGYVNWDSYGNVDTTGKLYTPIGSGQINSRGAP